MGMLARVAARWVRFVWLGVMVAPVVACYSITPARMVPEATAGPARKIALSVRVAPATGAGAKHHTFGWLPNNDEITQSLVQALQAADIFSTVSTREGDLELAVSVLAQDMMPKLYPTTARMLATYRFTAPNANVVWSETYDTTFSSANLGGSKRVVEAKEGAVRENIKALIQGIKDRWPAQ